MGKIIHISVRDKVALYSARDGAIICGNDDYRVQFALDPEWDGVPAKARFIWNGQYEDVPIVDGIAKVPRIIRAHDVRVGVYSEDESLQTTTAARVPCSRSILCDTAEPTEGNEAFYASEAQEAADRAEAAADRAEAAGGNGGTGGGVVVDPESVNQAQEAAQAALESAEAAADSAQAAGQSAEEAETSKNQATAAEEAAAEYAAEAANAEQTATTAADIATEAKEAAETAKNAAEGARDTAIANAEMASTSATVAAREAGNASKSSAAAATDRTAAEAAQEAAETASTEAGQKATEAKNAAQEAAEAAIRAQDAVDSLDAMPYGHSAAWLEENGDPAQLYQIDGYAWGYVSGGGWTKSEIQYLVVSAESDMVNEGGTPYLLRKGDEGTVYAYTEANADASIREVDELPESAEGVQDGDLVGYKGGKYQADVTTQSVPAYTNLAKTVVTGYQLGSSGTPKEEAGAAYVEEYIPFQDLHTAGNPTTVRIRGLGNMKTYNVIGASALDKAASASAKANNKSDVFSYAYDAGTDTVTLTTVDTSSVSWKYLRVVGVPSNGVENVIVTVNEPIENKTVTTVNWNRVGDYNPVFAGWSATEETYPVMDQKDEAARHGDEAVYAGDGYLYTYLVNAGWARGGRYDSLLIDSQLSKTSKNAIQNSVVAGELESIKLRADSTDKKIAEVDGKVAAMAGRGGVADIPVVWKEAVKACIASIKSHQEGRHCVTFPFFSDNHQRNGFAGILIAHVMRECGIPYCFFGGDAITSGRASSAVKDGTATVEQEMIAQDKAFDNAMSYIPRGRFCRAVGNHDGYLLPYKDPETGTVYGETVRYDRNRVYELFLRAEGVEQNKHFGGDGTYYYVEDLPSKVRFIVLNTNPTTLVGAGAEEIDATQLAWMRNNALHIGEDGWSVVIFSHCPISNHYQANVSNAAEVIATVNACTSADGSDGKPAMIGWFSGHLHRDRIYTGMAVNSTDDSEGTPLGFTQVTITSDANLDYDWLPSGGQPTTRPDLTRDMNGDTSHAIDFVTVNTERGEVYITRLGMGADRSYAYKD